MKWRVRVIAGVAVGIMASVPCVSDELRHNPFSHPKLDGDGIGSAARPFGDSNLVVNAVLVAGDRSLASVNGTVLGIGEEWNGYVLRAVEEEAATFTRDDRTITISLYEQREEEDED